MIKENITEKETEECTSFDEGMLQVEALFNKTLLSAPEVIRLQTEYLTRSRGKFIRAASNLACAENNDKLIHPDAVKVAAAIELLHLATLVHDDVIDNAKTRRGIATVQNKFGKRSAVICGDYLLCLSLKTAATVIRGQNYIKLDFPDYISRICIGELRQEINNRNFDLSFYNYLKIISGKTAALFEASFRAGAELCDDAKEEARLYSRLGRYTGIIFQLTDDCIDYESTQRIAKKPVLSDFRQGVITLPLIYTLQKNAELKNKAKAKQIPKEEISSAISENGGIDFTRMISRRYYDKALLIIDRLSAGTEKKERLSAILNKAFNGIK